MERLYRQKRNKRCTEIEPYYWANGAKRESPRVFPPATAKYTPISSVYRTFLQDAAYIRSQWTNLIKFNTFEDVFKNWNYIKDPIRPPRNKTKD